MLVDTPKLFAEYSAYHVDPVNRLTHFVGLPLGGMAVFGALARLELLTVGGFAITAGLLAVALLTAMNLLVDVRLALIAVVPALTFYLIGALVPLPILAVALVLGLAIPIGGHVLFEKKWPDTAAQFMRFEMVGHLWFLNLLVRVVPLSPVPPREASEPR